MYFCFVLGLFLTEQTLGEYQDHGLKGLRVKTDL